MKFYCIFFFFYQCHFCDPANAAPQALSGGIRTLNRGMRRTTAGHFTKKLRESSDTLLMIASSVMDQIFVEDLP